MGMLVYKNSKLNSIEVGKVTASLKNAVVIFIWPETKWSSLDQVEKEYESIYEDRTRVWAIYWDELWLGVKVQSNLV
jgi:hypothetical protein